MAFLMLLRSPQSVAMGRDLFKAYEDNLTAASKRVYYTILAVSMLASFGFSYWASVNWLPEYSGLSLFWRSAVVGFITINFVVAGVVVVAGLVMVAGSGVAARSLVTGVSTAVSVAAMAAISIAAVGTIAVAGVLVALLAGMIAGVISGIYLRAVFTRFWATLYHAKHGLRAFPTNWQTLYAKTDILSPAELIPDLDQTSGFHFSNLFTDLKIGFKNHHTMETILSVSMLLILYLPTYLYRIYLKSTAWLYAPLIWLAYVPKIETDGAQLKWRQVRGTRKWELFGMFFAFFSLVTFLAYTTNILAFLSDMIYPAEKGDTPPLILFLQNIDSEATFSWAGAWKGFLALGSFLTLVLYFWADHINKDKEHSPSQSTLRTVVLLSQLKAMITYAWLFSSIATVAYTLYSYGYMSGAIPAFIWGEACCLPSAQPPS